MSVGLDFHAVPLAQMPFYGEPKSRKAAPERFCPSCEENNVVTRLSRYYDTARTVCYLCEERANPLNVVPAPLTMINHVNETMARESRVMDALPVAASLAQPFTTPMLAEALGVRSWAASNTVKALVRRGLVVKVGQVKSQRPNNRGMLAQWRVKP